MSPTGEGGYPHGSVGEEAALLAAALEEWVRSAKETFGPLLTTALGAAAAKAAGFASGAAARSASNAGGPGAGGPGAAGAGGASPGGTTGEATSAGTAPPGGTSGEATSAGTAPPGGTSGEATSARTEEGAHPDDESSDGTDWVTDGLFGHLQAAAGAAQPGGVGECRYCPLCRMLAALRGPRSEVMEYLVEAATLLLAALRTAIEAQERSWVGGPPVPVEHIDIL